MRRIIERAMQYINDRTNEGFDDYFPCRKKNCKLKHIIQWLNLFTNYYNKDTISTLQSRFFYSYNLL